MSNTTITPAELLAGDVFLYHGNSFLSRMIRLFDGGDYSHASIYSGTEIVEALGNGISTNTVAASVAGAKFVDVYRYISDDGKRLRDPGLPDQPLKDHIAYFVSHRERYAYEEILLLAALSATRRLPVVGWIPGLGLILRNILDSAAELLNKLIAGGKEPVICSELVYRCYYEAIPPYGFNIRGADVRSQGGPMSIAATETASAAEARDIQDFQVEAETFLKQYAMAKAVSGKKGKQPKAKQAESSVLAIPDFVTPRDLQRSPNLYRVGTLRVR